VESGSDHREGEFDLEAEVVLDCSGQSTFLAAHEVTGPKYLGAYDKQIAIFSQISGFQRDPGSEMQRSLQPGNTLIYYKKKFHWAWCIPLDDDVVSVGMVSPAQYFVDSGETKEQFLRRELQERHPDLARRAEGAEFVEPVHVIPNYSFQVSRFAGKGFICVGDAHRFIDPIFSFGLYVTMKEAESAAGAVQAYLEGEGRDLENPFEAHVLRCEKGTDVLEDVIDGFWENPLAFSVFVPRSLPGTDDRRLRRTHLRGARPAVGCGESATEAAPPRAYVHRQWTRLGTDRLPVRPVARSSLGLDPRLCRDHRALDARGDGGVDLRQEKRGE